MNSTLSYTFQPQPPAHPKTTGGKRGPSAPIPIATSHSEDNDSDHSITDHTPPMPSRLTTIELTPFSSPPSKTSVISISGLSSPRNPFTNKKSGLALPSPRTLNNNNAATLNLNHVNGPSLSGTSHGSTTTTTPVLIINSNSNNTINISGIAVGSLPGNNNSNTSLASAPSLITSGNSNKGVGAATSFPVVPSSTTSSKTDSPIINGGNTPNIDSACSSTPPSNHHSTNSTLVNNNNHNNNDNINNNNSDNNSSAPSSNVKEIKAESPTSPRDRSSSPFSNFAYEHDHDYENVASPCSSTASGPIYVRPPGFKHHAQEIVALPTKNKLKKKKCLATLANLREGSKKREPTPPKLKSKREPLPMKLRALPLSFWQQPNVAHQISPSTLYLPPLQSKDSEEVMMDVRPVTPPDEREASKKQPAPERKLTVANTDLLFKLFEGVGEEKKSQSTTRTRGAKPRKSVPKSNTKGLFLGNDPHLVEAMTEKIFPQLTLEGSRHTSGGGNTSLQLITLKEGDKTVTLPSLSMEQNFPQMLSELVMHI